MQHIIYSVLHTICDSLFQIFTIYCPVSDMSSSLLIVRLFSIPSYYTLYAKCVMILSL